MEKKVQGSKVWIVIGQLTDGHWAGYFCFGIGNNPHQAHAVEWAGAVSSHIRFHLLRQGFEPKGVNNLVRGSFNLQATREAAEAVQDSNGRIKTRSQAAAEKVLQMHDILHSSWVDLTQGMTKLQKEEHARQQAIQALVQAKTEGLNRNYNFEDTHSINPIEGRSDDGTALTRTNNVSLGETAYDVVQQSNESYLEDVLNDPYSNKDKTPKVNLEMNEVHRNMRRTVRKTMSSSSDDGGSKSKSSVASDQEEGHDATICLTKARASWMVAETNPVMQFQLKNLPRPSGKLRRQHHLRTKSTLQTDQRDLLR